MQVSILCCYCCSSRGVEDTVGAGVQSAIRDGDDRISGGEAANGESGRKASSGILCRPNKGGQRLSARDFT